MRPITERLSWILPSRSPWSEGAPIRDELFGIERLEQHAESLAAAQKITAHPKKVASLSRRLKANAAVLLAAYRASAKELEAGRDLVPAAEWLLDNYHVVEQQIREIADDLPPSYYRQLPKLEDGPFAGYPRVVGIAWAYVAHTDSHFDPEILRRFIVAYQRVAPLTIGELWAIAISLRIVLIENLRRLAGQITAGRVARADAEKLAGMLSASGAARAALEIDMTTRAEKPLSERFAAELAKRLRDLDPSTTPALGWLEERLLRQGTTIDDVVQRAQHRQGASNLTVRNIMSSMRLISEIDWADLFESVSLVDVKLSDASGFAAMDFGTRNLYRSAIEALSRGSGHSELDVVDLALAAATEAGTGLLDGTERQRITDPGFHLIAAGRPALERRIGFRPPPRLWISRFSISLGIGGYIGAILILASLLMALTLAILSNGGLTSGWLLLLGLVGFLPATELATELFNRVISWSFGATALPGLDLKAGVPSTLRTLVVVPTLLTDEASILEQVEQLEVHHLSSGHGDISFALLTDGVDCDSEFRAGDDSLLAAAQSAIAALISRYGPGSAGDRFLILHRRRLFNPLEGVWMGWERKRGKLQELNRLLRGATDTSFMAIEGLPPRVPADVRYVVTLDADTRLPRDSVPKLIGKMAHPLNRPQFDAVQQRITEGYGILQPRVTPSLPVGRAGSLYQRLFSGPGGMDPYAAAISDIYQDLFGEGSYTGKGIYDVDAFEAAMAGRVPENTMLSHDLFEGVFARAGLASDIEVVEEFPARYDVAVRRQHRWTRGDWQLLPWLTGRGRALTLVGQGKILDNLRRSLLAPFTLAYLVVCWFLPPEVGFSAIVLLFAAVAIPAFLPIFFALLPRRAGINMSCHVQTLMREASLAATRSFFAIAFLPDQSWRATDAVIRTLYRLHISHAHLLEWTTAAALQAGPRLDLRGSYRTMLPGTGLGLGLAVIVTILTPASWPLILPFALIWLAAPLIAMLSSQPRIVVRELRLSAEEALELRLIARRTWRFFEEFVTAGDHFLPPDNFQDDPKPVIAHRTSPTNIGLYLLSVVSARDFRWIGLDDAISRVEATLTTMAGMTHYRGHLFNWYETRTLEVLAPAYVSSVDSGNLAGHLIALANAFDEWADAGPGADAGVDLGDHLTLARQELAALENGGSAGRAMIAILEEIGLLLKDGSPGLGKTPAMSRLLDKCVKLAAESWPAADHEQAADFLHWINAMQRSVLQTAGDPQVDLWQDRTTRLRHLGTVARSMALAMDFAFLLDPGRKLLSIGYSLTDNAIDSNCYDLLASEARLASLIAIAKGDVPTRHWFHLGRSATPLGNGSALISWSGSMFEYLMPSLVMRAPAGSLLEQTNRLVVERQQAYGRILGIPWGVSESAYSARDIELTYQYSNFGVPGLGLKRGLSENKVIAPYATGLASMMDARGALRNYRKLAELGARGRYGFREALDYTRSRLPEGKDMILVRNFMAHHQGMTIVAIANTLLDGEMRSRFHREPMIRACELLLQERMPRDVAAAHPRAEEVKASAAGTGTPVSVVRHLTSVETEAPVTHLLSNGRYAVMLTATGTGYSRWGDMAISRWRGDATTDDLGCFIFLRDLQSGRSWSAGSPVGENGNRVVFGEDHAEYFQEVGGLATTLDVIVSGEADGEVRRVTLTNSGRRSRDIQLTSYGELVLTSVAADLAHPAFAKMFIQTEYLADFGALIATRRPRSANEAPIWAAHFAVIEGETIAQAEYETDRAAFLGRGNDISHARARRDHVPLSGHTGTVLDPIFSLRQTVRIGPGKTAKVAFWVLVAPSRDALLELIDRHHDRNAFDRARMLAWTQAQVQLYHIGVTSDEAADFQQLAAGLIYPDRRLRASSEAIIRGAAPQSHLWPLAISGDLPILLLRIDDVEDIAQVRQMLRAHEYWRMKRLAVDLVILNERASSYTQDLQNAIETAVRSSQSRPQPGAPLAGGSVHALRADLISSEAHSLLQSIARIQLSARRGPISAQLERLPQALRSPSPHYLTIRGLTHPMTLPTPEGLEFANGLGGFDRHGREYVTVLNHGDTTPAPWINVIANPGFGFQISSDGGGYSFAENSRENQLTPWSNDPVIDPAGEAFYIRDEFTGEIWSPTAAPIRDAGTFIARHRFGSSNFLHRAHDIETELDVFVPVADPVKISRLTLRNLSGRARRLSVSAYADLVLGTARCSTQSTVTTERDPETGALMARNPWSIVYSGRVAFSDLGGQQQTMTGDRREFIGRNGSAKLPAALVRRAGLSGHVGAGFDPCAALQTVIDLPAGASVEVVWTFGQAATIEIARDLVLRYRERAPAEVLTEVTDHWSRLLGAVSVQTPDRALDIMLNGWLLYQTLSCRIWARSGFYQASGAYGFRDQLQDGMALGYALPAETRRHLLRAAARQFPEGDVQHWWLPQTGQGVRTRISDDRVWLAYAVATYIASSGDSDVLDEEVGFLNGPLLAPGDHDAFFHPSLADETASLFEHCARGLDQCLTLTGDHGLPLIGTGDWNDGMNLVGAEGRGESVWLGWLLIRTIALFAPLAEARDPTRAERWRAHAALVTAAIEKEAWDGAWYRRATFDDGSWLGSAADDECRIDAIAQSWAVFAGSGDPVRARTAMASAETQLFPPDSDIALLFTPPFDKSLRNPGYIKGYPPGLRENGGQYSHAAMWSILALARLGESDKALALFDRLNPINHALDAAAADRYKVEPYVVAADVYSVAPNDGHGGWTWYTGAAGWMYRAGVEGLLGITKTGSSLTINPNLPTSWSGFKATIRFEASQIDINVTRSTDGTEEARLSGVVLTKTADGWQVPFTSGHQILDIFC